MTVIDEYTQSVPIGTTWGLESPLYILGIIICIILGILLIAIAIASIREKMFVLGITSFLAALIGFMGAAACCTKNVYVEVPEYKIICDENVTIAEFEEKYELMEKDGNIYVVRDKGWEELINNGNS